MNDNDDHKTRLNDARDTASEASSGARTPRASAYWQRLRQWFGTAAGPVDGAWAYVRRAWGSGTVLLWRSALAGWRQKPYSGMVTLIAGSVVVTLLVWLSTRFFQVPTVGVVYLPLIAMLAYYWRWRLAIAGCMVQLICVYFLVLPPSGSFKALDPHSAAQLFLLAAVSVYVLLLVLLARKRRFAAEREVTRFAALNTVGTALSGELHESQLLQLIAETARDLTGAGFAAFTLRPVDARGKLVGPSEGSHFRLAAVVGVTPEQEELFRRMPLGGEGILAPIFRYGVTVHIEDALTLLPAGHHTAMAHSDQTKAATNAASAASESAVKPERGESPRERARRQAYDYAHGRASANELRAVGAPRGHPVTRSFLGAPLLDRDGNVRGGLLLGHEEPGRFSKDDETLLKALAAQASVALENARLYHNAQTQAEELNAVFESITDGVMVYDHQGALLHENHAASAIQTLLGLSDGARRVNPSIQDILARVGDGIYEGDGKSIESAHTPLSLIDAHGDSREFVVSVSPLQAIAADDELAALAPNGIPESAITAGGIVVVWHEVTETRKLLAEQQARAEAEARRLLLQNVIDELPSGVYLARGPDAVLELANHAAQDVWGAHWAKGRSMADFLRESGTQVVGIGGRLLETSELATVRALRTGEAIHHYQEVIRRPDGTIMPVLLNAVALDPGMLADSAASAAPGGSAHQAPERLALVVLQDVTAMKEAERLKDEFIAIAAHELKTPMAAVKGYADMLVRHSQNDDATTLEAWQVEALETIDQATNRLVELTEDLLDVARLQAERIQLHSEPHDLIALTRRVIKRFQMASDRHTLSLVAADEFVVATLDVRRTEQIVGNLLSNAIKYSPDGGPVTITIEQDERERVARLSVRDRGIGIPDTQQSLLFNRFARADNARERGITGTGLGLYLCRELVELQGGRLWFTSEEGCGSAFYVTLPLAEEPS
ncbi:MAG TPA: ATP-binding protein [Ktedonobacterales bacterium]|jgi:signal transduction histidine kinase/GAF domain-containing protein